MKYYLQSVIKWECVVRKEEQRFTPSDKVIFYLKQRIEREK